MEITTPCRIDSLRRNSRFRFAGNESRTGRLIDYSEGSAYVVADRQVDRVFQTKDGETVTIRKTTERIHISPATMVLPYRARRA